VGERSGKISHKLYSLKIMVNKILVALDSSDFARHVFDRALFLAKASDAKMMLLHVLSPEAEDSPVSPGIISMDVNSLASAELIRNYHQQWEAFEQKCLDLLRSLTEEATSAGVSTEFTQTPGSPGRSICNFAKSWEADLIVIGRRGRSGWSELILGSVSNYVIHHVKCSVFLVQN